MENFNIFKQKWLFALLALVVGVLSTTDDGALQAQDVPQIGCACADYLYMNSPSQGDVHKYLINPDGSLTEVNPGGPWIDNALDSPHGLGTDLNGYLYIGNISLTRGIDKIDCDGNIIEANFIPNDQNSPQGNSGNQTNIFSIGNTLYVNYFGPNSPQDERVAVYDLCTGQYQGDIVACSGTGVGQMWGFIIREETNEIIMNTLDGVAIGDVDTYLNNGCVPTVITEANASNLGVAFDENGNIFTKGSDLSKYDSAGNLLCSSPIVEFGYGMVYSEVSGLLYTSNNGADCVSIYDPNTCAYVGAAVVNTPDISSKAIAINTECCPLFADFEDNYDFCLAPGETIFLIDFLPCEFICAGTWNVVSNTAGTFNSCNNSFTYEQVGTGCFNYSYTPDPNDLNSLCEPFNIDICLNLSTSPDAPSISVVDNVCGGVDGSFSLDQDCVAGASVEFSTDGGFTWVPGIPAYDASAPAALLARCNDPAFNDCFSTPSAVVTNPELNCCVEPSAPLLSITNRTCSGVPGSINVVSPCSSSEIQFSLDGGTSYTTVVPAYADGISVLAKCVNVAQGGCESGNSAIVSATLPAQPSAPVLGISDRTCAGLPGSINILTPCSSGLPIQYSVDGGVSWSGVQPVYADGIMVMARCGDDSDTACISASSAPVSATLPPQPAAPVLGITDRTCAGAAGSINILTPCSNGLPIQYSVDGGVSWSGVQPVYADGISVIARCGDESDAACISASSAPVSATLPPQPAAPVLGITDRTCPGGLGSVNILTPCSSGLPIEYSVDGGVSWTGVQPAYADNLTVIARCGSAADPACLSANSASVSANAPTCIDLELEKDIITSRDVSVGDLVTYQISTINVGPDPATGVTVSDNLPVELTYISSSPSGVYDAVSGIWTIGDLAVGEEVFLEITVSIDAIGVINNIAQVNSANEIDVDSTPDNDAPSEDDQDNEILVLGAGDVGIVKSVQPTAAVYVGENVSFTLEVFNNGPGVATGVVVTDNLPSCVSYVGSSSTLGSYNAATGEWVIDNMLAGESQTLIIEVSVDEPGVCLNTTTVTSDTPDDDPTNNESEAPTEGIHIDLELTKVLDSPSIVNVGDLVQYTVTVENINDAGLELVYAANNVSVFDQLPSELMYVSSVASTGSYSSGTGIWTIGTIANGDSETLVITAEVLEPGDNIINVAQVNSADEPDIDSTPNNNILSEDDQEQVPLEAQQIDLELTKGLSSAVSEVNVGDQVTYVLTLLNAGPDNATGVEVTDYLPAEVAYVSDNPQVGSFDAASGIWTVGDVAVGDVFTLEITVEVLVESDAITNVTEVTAADQPDVDSTPDNNGDDFTTTGDEDEEDFVTIGGVLADLELEKTADASIVNVGDEFTYTLTLQNQGGSVANLVEVTDNLPSCVEYVNYNGSDASDVYNPFTGIWTVGTITVGEVVTMDITVRVVAPGDCPNSAQVSNSDKPDIDSTPDNDDPSEDDQDDAIVTGQLIDLELSKVASASQVNVGDVFDYTIELCNINDAGLGLIYDATGVQVFDQLPGSVSYVSHTATTGTYSDVTSQWNISTLANGACAQLVIRVMVDVAGSFDNIAQVSAADQPDIDSTPNNDDGDQSEDEEDIAPVEGVQIDLELQKSIVEQGPFNVGEQFTYLIVLENKGPNDATGVSVLDNLPAQVSYVSANPGVGSYDNVTGIWTVGSLVSSGVATLEIVVEVLLPGIITNIAEVESADQPDIDSDPSDNNNDPTTDDFDDEDQVSTGGIQIDLELSKEADVETVTVGDIVNYTITLENNGPNDATGVEVTESFPADLAVQFVSVSDGAFNAATGVWSVPSIAVGGIEYMYVTAEVLGTGEIINTVEVTAADQPDIDSTPDNDDGDQSEDDEAPELIYSESIDLEVVKIVDQSQVLVGDIIIYTVEVSNVGPDDASGVSLIDQLPIEVSYISYNATAGTYDPGTGLWSVGNLAVNGSAYLYITVEVIEEGTFDNVAQVFAADQFDIDSTPNNDDGDQSEDDEDPVSVTSVELVDIELIKTPSVPEGSVITLGQPVSFTIDVINKGPSEATNVTVEDQLPPCLSFLSAAPSLGSYSNNTGIWTIGSLAAGQTESLTITVVGTQLGTCVNVAQVSSHEENDIDSNPNNDDGDQSEDEEDSAFVIFDDEQIDLELTKTVDASVVAVGGQATFTLTLENKGPDDGTGIVVADYLPAGLSIISTDPSQGSYNNFVNLWTVGSLDAGDFATIEIVVAVNAEGPFLNVAEVTSANEGDIDSVTNNDDGDQSEDDEDNASFTTPNAPEEQVQIGNYVFIDEDEDGLQDPTDTPVPGVVVELYDTNGNLLQTTVTDADGEYYFTVDPNSTYVVSFPTTVPGGDTFTTANNGNDAVDSDPNAAGQVIVNVGTTDDFTIDAGYTPEDPIGPNQVEIGNYVFIDENEDGQQDGGDTPVSGVVVNLYDTSGNLLQTTTTDANGEYYFTVDANTSYIVEFPTSVPNGPSFTSTNTGNDALDSDPNAAGQVIVNVGTTNNYTIDAGYLPEDEDQVQIGNYVFIDENENGQQDVGDTPVPGVVVNLYDSNGNLIDSTITDGNGEYYFTVDPNATYIVEFPTSVPNTTGFTTPNSGSDVTDSDPNAAGQVIVTVGTTDDFTIDAGYVPSTIVDPDPVIDLELSKVASATQVNLGEVVSFTIVVENMGPDDGSGISVSDILPNGLTYINAFESTGLYSSTSGIWTIGNLAAGDSEILTITATVNQLGLIENVAQVLTANETDIDSTPGNDDGDQSEDEEDNAIIQGVLVNPLNVSDLELSKSVDATIVESGDVITYTIVLDNRGPDPTTNVSVLDQLPAGLSYVSAVASQGFYNATSSIWTVGSMLNGQQETLTITAQVNGSVTGAIVNVAQVLTSNEDDIDSTPGNDDGDQSEDEEDNAVITVVEDPVVDGVIDIELTKTTTATIVETGEFFTYTLNTVNLGPDVATGLVVNDALPAGLSFVSSTGTSGTTYNAATGDWTIGTLAVNGTASLAITVQVTATSGSILNVTEVVAHNEDDIDSTPNNDNGDQSEDDEAAAPVVLIDNSGDLIDLEVLKVVDSSVVNAGETATFTIVVSNLGPATATSVIVNDDLPLGLSYVGSSASQGFYNSGSGDWIVGTLAAGTAASLEVTVIVPEGSFVNVAQVTGADQVDIDSTPDNDDGDQSEDDEDPEPVTGIVAGNVTDLELSKVVNVSAPVQVGDLVTYSVVVENKGPLATTNVSVNDDLPVGLLYMNSGATQGFYNSSNGVWTIGSMAIGQVETLTITALVTGTGVITNVAEIISSSVADIDSTPNNDDGDQSEDDEDNAPIVSEPSEELADLELDKSVDVSIVNVGDQVTYTIVLENMGPSTATNVVVADDLPAGLSYVSASASQGVYNASSGNWSVGTMANGSTATLTITATVLGGAGNSINNIAQVSNSDQDDVDSTPDNDDPNEDDQDDAPISVITNPDELVDVELTKVVDQSQVNVGDMVTFTVEVFNNGQLSTVAATGLVVSDLLPSAFSYVGYSSSAGSYNPSTGQWTIGVLPINATESLTIMATLDQAGSHENVAQVSGMNETDVDSIPGNDDGDQSEDDEDSALVSADQIDLEVSKVANTTSATNGDLVTYTIEVVNYGPDVATNVQLREYIPSGLSYVSHSTSQGAYGTFTNLWAVGTLGVNQTETLTLTALVTNIFDANNIVEITAADQPDIDSTPDNDDGDQSEDDEDSYDINPAYADLHLTKVANASVVAVGDPIVFTIAVCNDGGSNATGVVANDLIPPGIQYASYSASQGSYTPSSGDWVIGGILAGGCQTIDITGIVTGAGSFTNTAEITESDQPDSDSTPDNDDPTEDDQDEVTVRAEQIDLELTKVSDATIIAPGGEMTYTIVVENLGPDVATGVEVTDNLPNGTVYIGSSANSGFYNPSTGIWTVGTLGLNMSASLEITVQVTASLSGSTIINVAEVSDADQPDVDSTPDNGDDQEDDQDEATTTITNDPVIDLELLKEVDAQVVALGDQVTYTIYVRNNSLNTATGVAILDLLPSGLSYVSSSASVGSYAFGSGLWTVGTLSGGGIGFLSITATVTGEGEITNIAQVVAADQPDVDSTPNNDDGDQSEDEEDSVTIITAEEVIDLELDKFSDSDFVEAGETIVYTIEVRNDGPDIATGVVVGDVLPAGLTYIGGSATNGSYSPATSVWNVGTIFVGFTETLSLTVRVDELGEFINVAQVIAADQPDVDSTPDNDDEDEDDWDDHIITSIGDVADVSLDKGVSNPTPQVGDIIVYTITVTNDGPNMATGVQVFEQLPGGLQYVSYSTTQGLYNAGTSTWTLGSLAVGQTRELLIEALVTGSGTITNIAEVSAQNEVDIDSTPGNNDPSEDDQDEEPIYVGDEIADLELSKVANAQTVKVGDLVTYTLLLTNNGPYPATGVEVYDLLPNGLAFDSWSATQGNYNPFTGLWTVGAVPVDGVYQLNIVAEVTGDGPITNMAQVSDVDQEDPDSDPNNNDPEEDDQDEVTIDTEEILVDLELDKRVSVNQAVVGEEIEYTIIVTNQGPDNATGVSVYEFLPFGLQYSGHNTSTGNYNPFTGLWTIGGVDAFTFETLNIKAILLNDSFPIVNVAEVVSQDQTDVDSTPNNNDEEEDDQDEAVLNSPDEEIDLSLTKDVDVSEVAIGDIVTYTITLTNDGPNGATGVIVADNLPPTLNYQGHSSSAGVYSAVSGDWLVGSIGVGQSHTLTIQAQVMDDGNILNVAQVSAADQPDVDSTPDNNDPNEDDQDDAGISGGGQGTADLSVDKSVDVSEVMPGESVTYTITLTNAGPAHATNVTVVEQLPACLSYISSSSSDGSYNAGSGLWTVPFIAALDSMELTLTGLVNCTGDIINSVEITESDQDDPDSTPDNDVPEEDDQDDVVISSGDEYADLSLVKETSTTTVSQGDVVTYLIVVRNDGPNTATGVSVFEQLPAAMVYSSSTVSQGVYNPTTGLWTIGSLANGGQAILELSGTVLDLSAPILNTAEIISSDQIDPDSDPDNDDPSEDDQDSVPINVEPDWVDLELEKSTDVNLVNLGDFVTYTLDLVNNGPATATNVVVSDILPAGLVYSSHIASGNTTYNQSVGTWGVLSLPAGMSESLTITAMVNELGMIDNIAEVIGVDQDDSDSTPNNDDPSEDDQDNETIFSEPTPGICGEVGMYVFCDLNLDGVMDPEDTGVENAIVTLVFPNGQSIDGTTDGMGYAAFINIPSGAGYTAVVSEGPDDAQLTTPQLYDLVLDGPGQCPTVFFGYECEGLQVEIGDYVFIDTNVDGIQDGGDSPVSGVTVNLYDASGTLIDTTTTDANGEYSFMVDPNATYTIEFPTNVPGAGGFTTPNGANGSDTADSDASGNGSVIVNVGVVNDFSIDAGYVPGCEGGAWTSENLCAYVLANPTSDLALADCDNGGVSNLEECENGGDPFDPEDDSPQVLIGNYVYIDQNENGIQDGGDTPVAGVVVNLYDTSGNLIDTTVTDSSGEYYFSVDPNGIYVVDFPTAVVGGSGFTTTNVGSNDAIDNDASGNGQVIVSVGTVDNLTIDAGYTPDGNPVSCNDFGGNGASLCAYVLANPTSAIALADCDNGGISNIEECENGGDPFNPSDDSDDTVMIGNYVFIDTNSNGIQDGGDYGVSGVVVNLYDAGGNLLDTTVTGANGAYSFTVAPNNTYVVDFPSNVAGGNGFTVANIGGNDATDSDASGSGQVVVSVGSQDDMSIDAGYLPGTAVVNCSDFGGNGASLCAYVLANPTSAIALADCDNGGISNIEECENGGDPYDPSDDSDGIMIGNYVFIDANANGVQDGGDYGVGGVVVNLYDAGGNLIATTVTDSNGLYSFTVAPNSTYVVEFPANVAGGNGLTVANAGGNDATDSDVIGNGQVVVSVGNQSDMSIDAGYLPGTAVVNCSDFGGNGASLCAYVLANPTSAIALADCDNGGVSNIEECENGGDPFDPSDDMDGIMIGNYVFIDANENGIQDGGDYGVGGVVVNLYDAGGNLIATTVTDSNGLYSFTVAPNSTYIVEFPANVAGGNGITVANAGGNDATDSDVIGNNQVVVSVGNQSDMSIDAGYLPGVSDCSNPIVLGGFDACTEAMTTVMICPEYTGLYTINKVESLYHCAVEILPNGCFNYTPLPGMESVGQDVLTIYFIGSDGNCYQQLATVAIGSCGVAPIAVDDAYTTPQNTPIVINIMGNDYDPDGDPINVVDYTQPANGTVTIVNGQFVYTPNAGFSGIDTFVYTIMDSDGNTDTATVVITVPAPANPCDAPMSCGPLSACTQAMTTVELCFTDCLGGNITIMNPESTYNCSLEDMGNGCLSYTPLPGMENVGSDVVTAMVTNGAECYLVTYNVTIDDACGNTAPVAVADSGVSDGSPITISVIGNDYDVDGDAITIINYTQGMNGSVALVNGQFVYTPNAGFEGIDTFTYTIVDEDGATSTATVTVYVDLPNDPCANAVACNLSVCTPPMTEIAICLDECGPLNAANAVIIYAESTYNCSIEDGANGCVNYIPLPGMENVGNDVVTLQVTDGTYCYNVVVDIEISDCIDNHPPVAVADAATTDAGMSVTIAATANDTDMDGDVLTVIDYSQGMNGSVTLVNGQFVYTPNAGFSGVDTFTYTVSDGNGGFSSTTVTVTVNEPMLPPVAVNDVATTDAGMSVTINVLGNDSEPEGETITISNYSQPANGTVTLVNGQFVYTPNAGFSGTDSFTYTITDADGLTSTASVTVTVSEPMLPPVAVNDAATTDAGMSVTINVLGNDSEPEGEQITITNYSQPSNGSVSLVNGQFVYTPNAGFSGTDSFTYTITDEDGLTSTATVSVTVSEPMLPPVAVNDGATTEGGMSVTINVLGNDSEPEGESFTITNYGQPGNGVVTLVNGMFVYTPNADFIGTDSFTYTITDEDGLTSTAVVTVVVLDCENAPEEYCTAPMTPLVICPFFCEFQEGYTIYVDYEITDLESLYGCSNTIISDECFRYMPLPGFVGTDQVTVYAVNEAGDMASTNVMITVSETCGTSGGSGECAPAGTACDDGNANTTGDVEDGNCNCAGTIPTPSVIANNDTYSTVDNQSITIDVLANDVYDCSAPSISIISSPSAGNVLVTGAGIIYIPELGGTGSQSFVYEVCCDGVCSTATAVVEVQAHIPCDTDALRLPNALTPNGDGMNDVIDLNKVFGSCQPQGVSFQVFDNLGREVFSQSSAAGVLPQWSAKSKSNTDLASGTYYYILSVEVNGVTSQSNGFIEVRR